jgi:outer membrane protein
MDKEQYMKLPAIPWDKQDKQSKFSELEPKPLTVSEMLTLLMNNSLAIQVKAIDKEIAADKVEEARGIYDLVLNSGVAISKTNSVQRTSIIDPETGLERRQDTQLPISSDKNVDGNVGIQQLIPSGGTLTLNFDENRDKINNDDVVPNPAYEATWAARFDQPLLRNFGQDVTNAQIDIARINDKAAFQDWRLQVMTDVESAMSRYWDLVFAINAARVTRLSLYEAVNLLEINEQKFKVGLLPSVDVLQAKGGAAARQAQLLQDLQTVNNIQDDLKRRLRINPGDKMWNYALVPAEPLVRFNAHYDLKACLVDAYDKRPEMISTRLQAKSLGITEKTTRNALLPSLDLFAAYGQTGLGHDVDSSLDHATNGDAYNWKTGLQFSFPLQNRQARYRYSETKKQIKQIGLQYQSQIDSIGSDVRNAVRAVDVSRERIETTRVQVEFEEAKLEAEVKRYEAGIAISQDVLNFQQDLANARSSYLRSVVDYNKALIQLDFVRGTILDNNHINVVDEEAKTTMTVANQTATENETPAEEETVTSMTLIDQESLLPLTPVGRESATTVTAISKAPLPTTMDTPTGETLVTQKP